ncbi:hypothetical protein [Paenimyroides ceti]
MVYKQITLYSLFLTFIFLNYNCKKEILTFDVGKDLMVSYKYSSIKNDNYCFNDVFDSLYNEKLLNDNRYFKIVNDSLSDFYKKTEYTELIQQFCEYTFLNEAYVLKSGVNNYLVLIGKSRGATGIGVDYWNYQCYSLEKKSKAIEFSSLSKTPKSIFFSKENGLHFITIDDNYPRPADGKELKLNYYPIIGSLYNEKEEIIKTIDYNCQN